MKTLNAIKKLSQCKQEYIKNCEIIGSKPYPKIIDEYNKAIIELQEVEAELAELTQEKSCEGCKWESAGGCNGGYMQKCIRSSNLKDHYTPKG